MPRTYKRKTNRQSWCLKSMEEAIKAVMSGTMGYLKAAKSFNVPQSTLEDRVKKANKNKLTTEEASRKGNLGPCTTVFSEEQEKELVEHILMLESRLFGLTMTDVRKLAYELAAKNNLSHRFNNEDKMAGKDWLYGFLKRHKKSLSLRNPENTSIARAMGFNKQSVNIFFDLLESLYDKHQFSPNDIYNVDETGITTVPNKPSKILALRGKKQVGALTSAERGVLVTVEMCMNASGNFMPAMFIFPRKRENPILMDDAPPGSFAQYHPSGWIQADIFLHWFRKFIEFSKPTAEKPVLLIFDGHATHIKSLYLINMARENNIILLCLPPHCSHRMQPLDVTFMAPLSTYYQQEVRQWLATHPGRAVTIHQVSKLFGAAFLRAANMQTAVNGFKETGIYPFNRNIFPEHLYAPSNTTDIPISSEVNVAAIEQVSSGDISQVKNAGTQQTSLNSELPGVDKPTVDENMPESNEPCCSRSSVVEVSTNASHSSSFAISPTHLMPLPHIERKRVEKSDKRRGKTAILTASPYKIELESLIEEKKKQEEKKLSRKRKLLGEEDNKPKNKNLQKRTKKTHKKEKSKPRTGTKGNEDCSHESDLEDTSDSACIYCNDLFSNSKNKEGWIQCGVCHGWAHESCSGAEEEDSYFTCDFCTSIL